MAAEQAGRIEWSRPPQLRGVDILLAERAVHRWVVFHETYTICTCLDFGGVKVDWTYRGRRHEAGTGTLMLMEPGEVHANSRVTPPITFRVVLIEASIVCRAAAELGMDVSAPHWKAALASDPMLVNSFAAFHASLETPSTLLEVESRLVTCIRLALERCSETGSPVLREPGRAALLRARDFIHEHYTRPVSLDELAAKSGLSRFHLVREFAREFSIPPHAYQVHVQVAKARALLAAGAVPANVAADAGFFDQSHLTRHFKAIYGVAPGEYRRGKGKRSARLARDA